jgi:carbon-monoxide dehydrogenase large subunit
MRLAEDGMLTVCIATTPQGQSHETVFAQVAAERFGWPLDRVRVLAGDSSLLPAGLQTAASRSAIEAGNGTALAADALREKVLKTAAQRLDAKPADLELDPSGIRVRDSDRWLPLFAAEVVQTYRPLRPRAWGPNVHAARVRVDSETGAVSILDYVIAHDAGPLINPRVVEGQLQGGLAHGLGYALFESLSYLEGGSLAGTTFADYLLPSAPELPIAPRLLHFESRSTQNAEGFRGVGEAGTIPAPAAVLSAIEAALASWGVAARLNELPATPETVFKAVHG